MLDIIVDEFLSLWSLSYSFEECQFFFEWAFELLTDNLEFV